METMVKTLIKYIETTLLFLICALFFNSCDDRKDLDVRITFNIQNNNGSVEILNDSVFTDNITIGVPVSYSFTTNYSYPNAISFNADNNVSNLEVQTDSTSFSYTSLAEGVSEIIIMFPDLPNNNKTYIFKLFSKNFLSGFKVSKNNNLQLNQLPGKYIFTDSVNVGSIVHYSYQYPNSALCTEQITIDDEFCTFNFDTDKDSINITPKKTGTTEIKIDVTDSYGYISEAIINLVIRDEGANQPPVVVNSPAIKVEANKLYINPSGSYDPDGSIVSYNYIIADCGLDTATVNLSLFSIDLTSINCPPPFDVCIIAKDNKGALSEKRCFYVAP